MKKRKLLSIVAILFTAFFLSCKDNEDDTNNYSNEKVNQWIYGNMKQYYLWNDKLRTSPDYSLTPGNFFKSILYTKEDRFSWIQDNYEELLNSLNGVASQEIGFEYMFWGSPTDNRVYIEVLYPKTGTDATQKGIVRGDFITSVNGQAITTSNYQTILKGSTSYTFNVCKNLGSWKFGTPTTITVNPSINYTEDPIYLAKTIKTDNGYAGYLGYNFFANDNGDDTHLYNKEMVSAFNKFIDDGITNLVLDLRYNSGGSVYSALVLASALVKSRSTAEVFAAYTYNSELTAYLQKEYGPSSSYFKENFIDDFSGKDNKKISIPKLGDKLNHIYILTGEYTASASELIINGLKPFVNITLIGDTTYGKNVGSISLYEEGSKTNKWGMQPIITKIWNSKGESDYTKGFAPNYLTDDYYDQSGYPRILKPLGDTDEHLLSIALGHINGIITKSSARSAAAFTPKASKLGIYRSARRFDMLVDTKRLPYNFIK